MAATFIQELLARGPSYVEHWLRRVQAGEEVRPSDVGLRTLAQLVAFQAQKDKRLSSRSSALQWARVAAAIYEAIASGSMPPSDDSAMIAAMMLRIQMIGQYGSVSGDALLDPTRITKWFLDGLTLSLEEAAHRAQNWRDLSRADIRELRLVKNRLSVIDALYGLNEEGATAPPEEIDKWLSLKPRLP